MKPQVGEKWFDNKSELWAITRVDEARIEAQGRFGVIGFFHAETLKTTSRFEDTDKRLTEKFIDEYSPQPRKKSDDQAD